MTERSIATVLASALLLGVLGGIALYLKVRPTEQQILQSRIDKAIGAELCDRIEADIDRFKKSPNAFKRTALHVLISESRTAARTLFHDLPQDFPFRFAAKPETLFADCRSESRQWVNIASAFPEYYEDERGFVGLESRNTFPRILPGIPAAGLHGKEQRLALVVGNAAYDTRPLKNPVNDAKDVAFFLRSVGFDVVEIFDADSKALSETIDKFVENAGRYDALLVYYSGHGIEFRGRNYLVPINASIQTEEEIPRQGVDANEVLARIGKQRTGAVIFVIDACRNVPAFSKFRSAKVGLDAMTAPSGTIVAFSAGPGQVAADGNGRNSPYTAALLKAARVPNKKIEDILKETSRSVTEESGGRQTPWYNSSLVGDFYFVTEPVKR